MYIYIHGVRIHVFDMLIQDLPSNNKQYTTQYTKRGDI